MSVGFGRFPIGVIICQGGSVSSGTSNYMATNGKTGPIEGGKCGWDVWRYRLGREVPGHWVSGVSRSL